MEVGDHQTTAHNVAAVNIVKPGAVMKGKISSEETATNKHLESIYDNPDGLHLKVSPQEHIYCNNKATSLSSCDKPDHPNETPTIPQSIKGNEHQDDQIPPVDPKTGRIVCPTKANLPQPLLFSSELSKRKRKRKKRARISDKPTEKSLMAIRLQHILRNLNRKPPTLQERSVNQRIGRHNISRNRRQFTSKKLGQRRCTKQKKLTVKVKVLPPQSEHLRDEKNDTSENENEDNGLRSLTDGCESERSNKIQLYSKVQLEHWKKKRFRLSHKSVCRGENDIQQNYDGHGKQSFDCHHPSQETSQTWTSQLLMQGSFVHYQREIIEQTPSSTDEKTLSFSQVEKEHQQSKKLGQRRAKRKRVTVKVKFLPPHSEHFQDEKNDTSENENEDNGLRSLTDGCESERSNKIRLYSTVKVEHRKKKRFRLSHKSVCRGENYDAHGKQSFDCHYPSQETSQTWTSQLFVQGSFVHYQKEIIEQTPSSTDEWTPSFSQVEEENQEYSLETLPSTEIALPRSRSHARPRDFPQNQSCSLLGNSSNKTWAQKCLMMSCQIAACSDVRNQGVVYLTGVLVESDITTCNTLQTACSATCALPPSAPLHCDQCQSNAVYQSQAANLSIPLVFGGLGNLAQFQVQMEESRELVSSY